MNFKSRNNGKVGGYDAPEYKFYIETARKYHKIWMETESIDPVLSMLLLIRKRVMFSNPPVSKHPQNTFVTMSCGWNPVKKCFVVPIGQAVISISEV